MAQMPTPFFLFYVRLHNSKLPPNPGDVVQFAFGDAREAQSFVVVEKRKVPKIGDSVSLGLQGLFMRYNTI